MLKGLVNDFTKPYIAIVKQVPDDGLKVVKGIIILKEFVRFAHLNGTGKANAVEVFQLPKFMEYALKAGEIFFLKSKLWEVVKLIPEIFIQCFTASRANGIRSIREPLYTSLMHGFITSLININPHYLYFDRQFYFIGKGFGDSLNSDDKEAIIFILAEIYRRSQPMPNSSNTGSPLEFKYRSKIISTRNEWSYDRLYNALHSVLVRGEWTIDEYKFKEWEEQWDKFLVKRFRGIKNIMEGIYKDDPHK